MREGIKLAKKLQQCIIQCASHQTGATPCGKLTTLPWNLLPQGMLHILGAVYSVTMALLAGMAAWRFSGGCGRTMRACAYGTCHSRTSQTGLCWCALPRTVLCVHVHPQTCATQAHVSHPNAAEVFACLQLRAHASVSGTPLSKGHSSYCTLPPNPHSMYFYTM